MAKKIVSKSTKSTKSTSTKSTKTVKKIREEDIRKNAGKEIGSTISRFKQHEKQYTFYLVVVFMIVMIISAYLGFHVDSYQLYNSSLDNHDSYLSFSSRLVFLNQKNIMSDADGLKSNAYVINFSNTTERTINYIIRLVLDEDSIQMCDCADNIVGFDKIHYSLDGKNVLSFSDSDMVVNTGTIASQKDESLAVRFWFNDTVSDDNCHFYGRFIFEELEDMS